MLDMLIFDAINSLGDGYYWIMKSLSVIGEGTTYFLIIVILIWCVNYKKYSKLALIIPFSGLMAESLKVVFHMLRPWHISEEHFRVYS